MNLLREEMKLKIHTMQIFDVQNQTQTVAQISDSHFHGYPLLSSDSRALIDHYSDTHARPRRQAHLGFRWDRRLHSKC